MYNKFIFLYTSNFTARVKDFFCLSEWVANNYDVEYWDLSDITVHEKLVDCNLDGLKIRKIKSIDDFQSCVRECSQFQTLYLTWVNYCWYSAEFYKVLSKYGCHYAYFDNGLIPPIPTVQDNSTFAEKMKKKFGQLSISKIKSIVIRSKSFAYHKQKNRLLPAKYYFKIVESYTGVDKIDADTTVGWCNSGDFENDRQMASSNNNKYIVFLDQYIPYHNDNILNGQRQVCAEDYYCAINRCFSLIEKKYKLPVVVAAHPAATKYKLFNPFEGRMVIFDKTSELVKNSSFVLAHFTTAISYVVLNKKKILFLTSNAIKEIRPQTNSYIEYLAQLLGAKCLNQDTATIEDLKIDEIDVQKYNQYKYSYLTNNHSEAKTNFQNIIDLINSSK